MFLSSTCWLGPLFLWASASFPLKFCILAEKDTVCLGGPFAVKLVTEIVSFLLGSVEILVTAGSMWYQPSCC